MATRSARHAQRAGERTRNPKDGYRMRSTAVARDIVVRRDARGSVALHCCRARMRAARTTREATFTSQDFTFEHQTDAPEAVGMELSAAITRVEASVLRMPVTLIRLRSWR